MVLASALTSGASQHRVVGRDDLRTDSLACQVVDSDLIIRGEVLRQAKVGETVWSSVTVRIKEVLKGSPVLAPAAGSECEFLTYEFAESWLTRHDTIIFFLVRATHYMAAPNYFDGGPGQPRPLPSAARGWVQRDPCLGQSAVDIVMFENSPNFQARSLNASWLCGRVREIDSQYRGRSVPIVEIYDYSWKGLPVMQRRRLAFLADDPELVACVPEWLEAEDFGLRINAARVLRYSEHPSARESLLRLLHDPKYEKSGWSKWTAGSFPVRLEAYSALTERGDTPAAHTALWPAQATSFATPAAIALLIIMAGLAMQLLRRRRNDLGERLGPGFWLWVLICMGGGWEWMRSFHRADIFVAQPGLDRLELCSANGVLRFTRVNGFLPKGPSGHVSLAIGSDLDELWDPRSYPTQSAWCKVGMSAANGDLTGPDTKAYGWSSVGIPYAWIVPFSTILPMVHVATLYLRSRRRRRNHLCLLCGYDLRGHAESSSVCPECGHSINRPPTRTQRRRERRRKEQLRYQCELGEYQIALQAYYAAVAAPLERGAAGMGQYQPANMEPINTEPTNTENASNDPTDDLPSVADSGHPCGGVRADDEPLAGAGGVGGS